MALPVTVATLGTDTCLTPSPVPQLDTRPTPAIRANCYTPPNSQPSLTNRLKLINKSTLYLLFIWSYMSHAELSCVLGVYQPKYPALAVSIIIPHRHQTCAAYLGPGASLGGKSAGLGRQDNRRPAAKSRAWAGATTPLHLDPAAAASSQPRKYQPVVAH